MPRRTRAHPIAYSKRINRIDGLGTYREAMILVGAEPALVMRSDGLQAPAALLVTAGLFGAQGLSRAPEASLVWGTDRNQLSPSGLEAAVLVR